MLSFLSPTQNTLVANQSICIFTQHQHATRWGCPVICIMIIIVDTLALPGYNLGRVQQMLHKYSVHVLALWPPTHPIDYSVADSIFTRYTSAQSARQYTDILPKRT
jgi:hypothetical protein